MINKALEYIEAGIPVFPCLPGSKKPMAESSGFKDATVDPDQIERWWTGCPKANIGIPTGQASGLIVIDVDGADNSWPNDPIFEELLSSSVVVRTPRGGVHYIFVMPEGKNYRNTASLIAKNVDTRGDGGYILAGGSEANGKKYDTVIGSLTDDSLCLPPKEIIALLDEHTLRSPSLNGSTNGAYKTPNIIEMGARNATLTGLAGVMRRSGMGFDEIYGALSFSNMRCEEPLPESEVKRIVTSVCRYEPDGQTVDAIESEPIQVLNEHKPIPESMMYMEGWVGEYMEHVMNVSIYPNKAMAFGGAVAMASYLIGRNIRCSRFNTAANVYMLGLAHSGEGKDQCRRVNKELSRLIGKSKAMGDSIATIEGVEDALVYTPCMLFQPDEIDAMFAAAKTSTDTRWMRVTKGLNTLYTSVNSVINRRRLANAETIETIVKPYLSLYGTAIPEYFFGALNKAMLDDGFMARTIVVLSQSRRCINDDLSHVRDTIPEQLVEIAKYWVDFTVGGELNDMNPKSMNVDHTADAYEYDLECGKRYDELWWIAKTQGDSAQCSIWARAWEQQHTMQLINACSKDHMEPIITLPIVRHWHEFIMLGSKWMLHKANMNIFENKHEENIQRVIEYISGLESKSASKRDLTRKFRSFNKRDWDDILHNIEESGAAIVLHNAGKNKTSLIVTMKGS